ncbi:hypothetical protein Pan153_13200 [Gimesia panareensis]|uniref:Uncharacterized protein n=1 Tax=Gimesia panareensis TaxID=2527978 RepID=A0A517Q6B4_9PLAN|nr:hypothetical protein [Gimesia panareensis]QDT27126.1 hypothetical protein Enr10x_24400 [Gimesia panareensis]QDV16689.1 hypothetical protein Pan153_13200 [Gimesia panareensis]
MESELTSAPDLPETETELSLRKKARRRYLIGSLIQVTVFLSLYVLSIGPLFWQWYASFNSMSSPFFAAFYMPLLMACDICPPLADGVNWYINLWIG